MFSALNEVEMCTPFFRDFVVLMLFARVSRRVLWARAKPVINVVVVDVVAVFPTENWDLLRPKYPKNTKKNVSREKQAKKRYILDLLRRKYPKNTGKKKNVSREKQTSRQEYIQHACACGKFQGLCPQNGVDIGWTSYAWRNKYGAIHMYHTY